MIVVVTGANGFLGRHLLLDQLARGRLVRGVDLRLDRLADVGPRPGLDLRVADICDLEAMAPVLAGADVVFHLASAHLDVTLGEEAYYRINRDGAAGLARLARRQGVRRFVHCSSVGVYGEIRQPPADETTPCRPDLVYEKSKLAGEEAVTAAARETGLALAIMRPAWVYGPGCPRTEKLFRSLRKGTFFYVGDGRSLRHCLYVEDFNEACDRLATRPEAVGEVFVIGDRGAVTLRELMEAMAAAAGCRRPRLRLPRWLVFPLFAVVERLFLRLGRRPPVSTRTLKFFTNNTAFSIAKARQRLGFEPRFDLAEGMRRTWAALRPPSAGPGRG
ncbi:MAG: NAD-dependent epimerase/dehydratase family protein [Candidatus Aminicenantes bacterium]|nr:NAD-dependent epimerase/dehydratase family protein [Candidatus Aminicenantes bacterium]